MAYVAVKGGEKAIEPLSSLTFSTAVQRAFLLKI